MATASRSNACLGDFLLPTEACSLFTVASGLAGDGSGTTFVCSAAECILFSVSRMRRAVSELDCGGGSGLRALLVIEPPPTPAAAGLPPTRADGAGVWKPHGAPRRMFLRL